MKALTLPAGEEKVARPFPATASAEGAQFNVPPSPAKGEGGDGKTMNRQADTPDRFFKREKW